ncbi:hypothetical protein FJY84_01145 [Candidatus Bathyarchaeota archaeon]|nr:hypothetical protein [Candidatus Bathyarchaeota archaeon]
MKLQQEEKILSFFFKKETLKEKTLRVLSSLIKNTRKMIEGLIEGLIKWIYYPSIEPRSLFVLERSQLVKKWPKIPNLNIKLKKLKKIN